MAVFVLQRFNRQVRWKWLELQNPKPGDAFVLLLSPKLHPSFLC